MNFLKQDGTEVWMFADSALIERGDKITCFDFDGITDENMIFNGIQKAIFEIEENAPLYELI